MAVRLPASLAALESLISGLGGGARQSPRYSGPGIFGVPTNPDGSPDLTSTSGPGLERAGNLMADAQDERFNQQQDDAVRTSAHPIDQARAQFMGKLGAGRGGAGWRGFFGLMNGKKAEGFGQPSFAEGRVAPGTTDVIDQAGPTYSQGMFDDSTRDASSPTGFAAGSMAGRSGLSQRALRILAGLDR